MTTFITEPMPLGAWTARLRDAEIPVLRSTVAGLAAIGDDLDRVDANSIASIVLADPLMTLKLLKYVAGRRRQRVVTDAETVTAAVLLTGIEPFFREFGAQTAVEDWLVDHPAALQGLRELLSRAHRAATFSLAFAVHRKDNDAEILHEAALVHDFAEELVWCHAPELSLEIRRRQREDSTLRSAAVQREVLGVELCDLEQALMRAWRLPDLLVSATDDRRSDDPRVRNVLLAIRLARHSEHGWRNPALPDDFSDIGSLLNLAPTAVRRKVLTLDV